MGQMLVRNLDDSVIEGLKRRASERGTSLEQFARDALTEAPQKALATLTDKRMGTVQCMRDNKSGEDFRRGS